MKRRKGVALNQKSSYGNKRILNKYSLTRSEWTAMMKMSANVFPVRSLPGRSQDGPECRHVGCTRRETLPHILGDCEKGSLLRNERHNEVVRIIMKYLRQNKKWTVQDEVHCVGENSSTRRVDILCFDKNTKQGYI